MDCLPNNNFLIDLKEAARKVQPLFALYNILHCLSFMVDALRFVIYSILTTNYFILSTYLVLK